MQTDCFLHMDHYAKGHLIEQIMCLVGRGMKRARQYRDDLESMTLAELRSERDKIEDELGKEI